jgi:hypothetical protein
MDSLSSTSSELVSAVNELVEFSNQFGLLWCEVNSDWATKVVVQGALIPEAL